MFAAVKRFLFGQGNHPRRVLFGSGRGIRVLVDPAEQTQRLIGTAELEISRDFVSLAKISRTFCDVGASDGWYCLLALKHNPQVHVIAIEPERRLSDVAHQHMLLNGISESQRIKWFTDFCGATATRLDSVLSDCAEPILLKIDIEGAELDALQSGSETLSKSKCNLIIETHSTELESECSRWLQGVGYKVRVVTKGSYRMLLPERRPLPHNQWLVATRDVP